MNTEFETIKVSAVSPRVYLGNVEKNLKEIQKHACEEVVQKDSPDIVVFPEMSLTGYTCADLFFQNKMTESCEEALLELNRVSYPTILVIGAPLYINSRVYNCAIVINRGKIVGIVPKTFLPTYGEFYEQRWFDSPPNDVEYWNGIPVGNSLVFEMGPDLSMTIDVCEDLWAPIPPSTRNCLNGANIVLNLSASNELVGKHFYRTNLVTQQSAKMNCAYVYVSAGLGESTTDTVYLSNHIIVQNGSVLTNEQSEDVLVTRQFIDYGLLNSERKRNTTFRQSVGIAGKSTKIDCLSIEGISKDFVPSVSKLPFVPNDTGKRYEDVTKIQRIALQRRLDHIGVRDVVIGVSGGLDSTLALMVSVSVFDVLRLPREGIHAISMPCFGTTEKTKNNARLLSEALGLDFREIDISESVTKHMSDIGADIEKHDLTYENCQARERTQVLMDLATYYKGIVVGTGDMSEMAIGWCTYNGDHMSMYNVNCGIPKTLVKYLIRGYVGEYSCDLSIRDALDSILNTEISPELLPPDKDGKITQKTEDIVGPYEFTDFFLFYTMRYDFSTEKILAMAIRAFAGDYSDEEIKKWFAMFRKRFYASQFKRSCVPDGPKIGSIALSPRADLRMPSDAVL